jgi:hypothetical protein
MRQSTVLSTEHSGKGAQPVGAQLHYAVVETASLFVFPQRQGCFAEADRI